LSTPASSTEAPSTVGDLGERRLIERIKGRFSAPPNILPIGIGDDAAVAVPVRGALQVLTTDAVVEGVHFDLAYSSFADVGYKALAVNVSDIAAMGATPRLALLSLILPERMAASDVDAVLDGFAEMASTARVALAGGNTTRSPNPSASGQGPLIVDVAVLGSVKPRKALTRCGGRPGDVLYVTGTIGAAAAGLDWLRALPHGARAEPDDPALRECVSRHRRPAPRLRLGAIAGQTRAANACMDLSDGLADAVTQIAEQSGTGAAIDAAALPVHPGAVRWFSSLGRDPVEAALSGGDDYELLFAVPTRFAGRFRNVIRHAEGVPITRIGELTAGRQLVLTRDGRPEPLPSGFVHF
jgi:thiamine-monophosphate kinase